MPFVKKNDSQGSWPPTDARKIFIGRTGELLFFVQNILKPEEVTHNIISISGQGGVGKSTLLARFIDEAHSAHFKDYCLTAMVDERQTTPSSIMEKFADQLRMAGKFEKALKRYKETLRRLQIERETMQDTLSRRLPDFAGAAAESVPIAGPLLREGVKVGTRHLLERYHISQLRRDAELLEDPLDDLTKAFVGELNRLVDTRVAHDAHRARRLRVILFFDTFEQLGVDAAPWLLDYFLEASINNNVVLVVAGRDPIEQSTPDDPKRWLPYRDSNIIYSISLDGFTEEETRLYLAERDITDPDSAATIWQLSRGLPLYLGLLTSNLHGTVDPTANVVTNFLRWIPEQEHIKRQLALEAALFSRSFNQDDLEAFAHLPEDERPALYRWLIGQPFVRPQDGRYSYHDLARELFSRHFFQRSQKGYYASRRALAKHYQRLMEEIQSEEGEQAYRSARWRELALALAEQLFLLPDEASHIKATEKVLYVYERAGTGQEGEVVGLLRKLAQEGAHHQVNANARRVARLLLRYIETKRASRDFLAEASALLENLADEPSFPPALLAALYRRRGNTYARLREHRQALKDFDRALQLDPKAPWAYANRAHTYRWLGEYHRALKDFDCALQLDPKNALVYAERSLAHCGLDEFQHAVEDCNHALELDPKETWAYICRSISYRELHEYQRGVEDCNHALELDPKSARAYLHRGITYRILKDHQRAIEDFTRAVALDPDFDLNYLQRGITYREIKDYRRAIDDFIRLLELNPKHARAYSQRALTYLWMKDTGQATADYVRSWELDSTSFDNRWMVEWAMCQRKPDLAMAERLEQIASVDLQNVRAYVCRGVALWLRGNLELSLTELEQAIAVEPEGWDGYFWKGMTCASLGRGEEARAAIEKSLEAGLPPVLLAPLRWFEQERPEFYEKYAAPVLARYDL